MYILHSRCATKVLPKVKSDLKSVILGLWEGVIILKKRAKSYEAGTGVFAPYVALLLLGAFHTSPIPSLYVEADEPSLSERRIKLALQYIAKLK